MKNKLLFALIGLMLPLLAAAQRITDNEAKGIASQVLGKQVVKAEVKKPAKAPGKDGLQADPFYSIYTGEDGQGFVIVSTDRRAPQIIGYGDGKADANNLPPQLKAILAKQDSVLQATPNLPEHSSWRKKAQTRAGEEGGKLLKTANWGQGYPYNLMTPEIDGEHCPTGCVATAMAIAMQYNGWPEKYDWQNMPTEDNGAANSMTIAKLMADAGESVYMNYKPWESGAHMNWVGHKLQSEYQFSPECQYITAANFTQEQWVSMLRENLENDEVVIYNGTGTGNHAFVIDGYQGQTYHINWGWDGLYNGYFGLDALSPGTDDYSNNAGMVINITPDKSGVEYSDCFVDYGYFWVAGGLLTGCRVDCNELIQDKPFAFNCYSYTLLPGFEGSIGLALVSKDNVVKQVLKSQYCTTWDDNNNRYEVLGNNVDFNNLVITTEIQPTDRLQIVSKKKNESDWKIVLGTIESPSYLNVTDVKASMSEVTFIMKSTNLKMHYSTSVSYEAQWIEEERTTVQLFKGAQLDYVAYCEDYPDAIIALTAQGKCVYGDQETKMDKTPCISAIKLFGDQYTIVCDLINPTKEKDIVLEQAGELHNKIDTSEYNEIASLKISGNLNATDFWFIRDNIIGIKSLDLSEVFVVEYTGLDPKYSEYSANDYHSANTLPALALAELSNLVDLKLPLTIEATDNLALTGLAITSIEIPESLRYIGINTFSNCPDLEYFICKSTTPPVIPDCALSSTKCPDNGVLFVPVGSFDAYNNAEIWSDFSQIIESDNPNVSDLKQTIDGVKYRLKGNTVAIYGYDTETLKVNLVIPDEIAIRGKNYPVTEIEESAFQSAPFESCVISNNITTIGERAFVSSNAKKIVLPNQLRYIPNGSFGCCYLLEELEIPESVETIGNALWDVYNLKKLYIPKNTKREYRSGNFGCGFWEIDVHPENEDMCVADGVLFNKEQTLLLNYPKQKTGEYVVPSTVMTICNNAFVRCEGLTGLRFNNNDMTFNYMSITDCPNISHIEFSNGALFANNSIVHNLTGLKSMALADGAYTNNVFGYLPNLEKIYMKNKSKINLDECYYENAIPDVDYYCQATVPTFSVSTYNNIYVPGGTSEAFSQFEENKVHEMWQYRIYRDNNAVSISNVIDGLEIQSVVINGKEIEAKGSLYCYEPSDELYVVINYRLHDRQDMTTHYDADFNANVPSSVLATSITLNASTLDLTVGNEAILTAIVLPDDATDKTVTWTSSDESVATVSSDGLVAAINVGTVVITATCGEASATCTVMVTPDSYNITYLVDGEVYHTETVKIGATITPIAEPEKEGHTFSGWSEIPETMPAHDVTVTGTFTVNKYMVRYYDGETLLAEFEVEFGAEIPQYEYNNEEFIFERWEGETYETMPAHDIAFYAVTTPNGIADVKIDDNAEITLYDLTGMTVYKGRKAGMPKHLQGLYIIKSGDKVVKFRL